MGKTSLCIQMLKLLNDGRTYKVSELADLLETKPRNILEYKNELLECGYCIISVPGKYGGYKLDKLALMPSTKLTQDEKKVLNEGLDFICSKRDFINKKDYQIAMSKILSTIRQEERTDNLLNIDKYQLSMNDQEIQKRYTFIETAINEKSEIKITYNSLKSGYATHILHPYKLFLYNNSWFFLAWNTEVGEVWTFKVNRIDKYEETGKKFKVWKYFNQNDYLDKYGMINYGEYYHIELIANNKRAMLMKERVYGKNQVVEKLDNTHVKVSLDMQNKESILSFILGCGTDVEVLEPEWLKEGLLEKLENIKKMYKKKSVKHS